MTFILLTIGVCKRIFSSDMGMLKSSYSRDTHKSVAVLPEPREVGQGTSKMAQQLTAGWSLREKIPR